VVADKDFSHSKYLKTLLKNISSLKGHLAVVKLPFSIINDNAKLEELAGNLNVLSECGIKFILIADYQGILEQKLKDFNLDKIVESLELDHEKSIEIYEMILSGYVVKHLASKLTMLGLKVISLSGKDAQMIVTKNIRRLKFANDTNTSATFIAEPVIVWPEALIALDNTSIIPIIAPIGCCENGGTSVVEIDKLVAKLGVVIGADHIIYLDDSLSYLYKPSHILSIDFPKSNYGIKNNSIIKGINYIRENSSADIHLINPDMQDFLLAAFFYK
jgi:acetylglutamate kinase